jgi:hypothetical protein
MAALVAAVFFLIVVGFGMTPIAFLLNRPRLAYFLLRCALVGFAGFCLLATYGAA